MIDDKWTPGPRAVRKDTHGARVVAHDGTPIGWHGRNGSMGLDEAHANAALDAAAPAMVEALRAAHDALVSADEQMMVRFGSSNRARTAAINLVKAALALAEGGQS